MKKQLLKIRMLIIVPVLLFLGPVVCNGQSSMNKANNGVKPFMLPPVESMGITTKPLQQKVITYVSNCRICSRCRSDSYITYIDGQLAGYIFGKVGKAIETPWILSGVPSSIENRREKDFSSLLENHYGYHSSPPLL